MSLQIPVFTILILLMIPPLPRSTSYKMQFQFNKDTYNFTRPQKISITHLQMDTAVRILRPRHHYSQRIVLPPLDGRMLDSQNRKKESTILVAKRQRKGKARENGKKIKSMDWSENFRLNKHTPFLTSPVCKWQAQAVMGVGGRQCIKRRSQDGLRPLRWGQPVLKH